MERLLISGGTRGLGLALCGHHLAAGRSVFTFGRSRPREFGELEARYPGRFFAAVADLTDPRTPREMAEQASQQLGSIDGLINNAAMPQDALLAHMSDDEIAMLVTCNFTATVLLTRHVVRRMLRNRTGVVLNISSICAKRGFPGLTVYSATKGALEAFTRSLAVEMGAGGIRVNAIAPGFFESEMSSALSPRQVSTIVSRSPLQRLATVEEVVQASDLLLLNPSITGHVLHIDAGAAIA